MEYYIQRVPSGYLGNAPIWWCKDGRGYSAYLENAERFSHEEAMKLQDSSYGKYKAWPCDFIDSRSFTVFDMQYFHELEQWEQTNDQ